MNLDIMLKRTKDNITVAYTNTTYDDHITRWLNDGGHDFSSGLNWPFLENTKSTAIVQYKYKYDLPADNDTVKDVVYRKDYYLKSVNRERMVKLMRSDSYGTPAYFLVWQGKLNIWPQPDDTPTTPLLASAMAYDDVHATLTIFGDMEPKGRVLIGEGDSVEVIGYSYMSGSQISVLDRGTEGTSISAHDVSDTVYYLDLETTYYKTLTDLTTTPSTMEIPTRYHELPVLYATAMFFYKVEDKAQGDSYMGQYLTKKEKAKADLGAKSEDRFRTTLDDTPGRISFEDDWWRDDSPMQIP